MKRRLNHSDDATDLAHDTPYSISILKCKVQLYFDQLGVLLTTVAKGILIDWCQRKSIVKAYLEAISRRPEHNKISSRQNICI